MEYDPRLDYTPEMTVDQRAAIVACLIQAAREDPGSVTAPEVAILAQAMSDRAANPVAHETAAEPPATAAKKKSNRGRPSLYA